MVIEHGVGVLNAPETELHTDSLASSQGLDMDGAFALSARKICEASSLKVSRSCGTGC